VLLLQVTKPVSANDNWEKVAFAYGLMVAHMGSIITVYETCINYTKQTNQIKESLKTEFNNWKQRHSYADQIRDSFNSQLVKRYGSVEARKLIDKMFSDGKKDFDDLKNLTIKEPYRCVPFNSEVKNRTLDFHTAKKAEYQVLVSSLK